MWLDLLQNFYINQKETRRYEKFTIYSYRKIGYGVLVKLLNGRV